MRTLRKNLSVPCVLSGGALLERELARDTEDSRVHVRQRRQPGVVRVEPEPARLAAKEMNWGAVLSTMKVSDTANAPVTVDPALLMAKAMRLLDEGDIAGARVMFQRAVEAGGWAEQPVEHDLHA